MEYLSFHCTCMYFLARNEKIIGESGPHGWTFLLDPYPSNEKGLTHHVFGCLV